MKRALQVSLLVFLFLLMGHSAAQAQLKLNFNPYWEGEITLVDGTVRKGLVKVPSFLDEKTIAIKQDQDGEKELFKSIDIKSVKIYSPSGIVYVYDNVPYIAKTKGKKVRKPILLLIYKENAFVKVYYVGNGYKVDEKLGTTEVCYSYNPRYDTPTFHHFIWKRGAAYANLLTITGPNMIGGDKMLLKRAKLYLTETPSIIEKIENKELRNRQIRNIIDLYLEETKDM